MLLYIFHFRFTAFVPVDAARTRLFVFAKSFYAEFRVSFIVLCNALLWRMKYWSECVNVERSKWRESGEMSTFELHPASVSRLMV